MDVGDSPDWPPPGWTEDVKVTNGRKIKYYTNGETGKKFYSKKEVTRYLNRKDTCDDVTQAMNYHGKSCSENNVNCMNNQGESISKENVCQIDNQDKSCSENNASQTVGGPNNSHEWLPPGWIVELKTRKSGSHAGSTYKVFVDPSTGNKFYSKPEVSKYLKTMKQNNIVGGGQIHGNGEVSSSNQKRSEDSKNIRGRGLSRISRRQKSDTDQASPGIEGSSFFKQKASQDFEEVGEQSCIAKRKKSGIKRTIKTSPSHGAGEDFILVEKTSLGSKENGAQSPQSKRQKPGSDCPSAKSVSSSAADCDSADELPPGWKKEVISRQTDRGTRKDTIYTDPVHGYKFHSKKELSRYLHTGDATRPAKKNVASTSKDDSPMTDDASLKKFGCFMTGRKLFAVDQSKGEKGFGTFSPSQQFESSKKLPDCSVSDPNAIITSILAEINENHSFENVEDDEIETVVVGVEQPSAVATESDLPETQLLENKQEKHSYKAAMQQSRKSRNTESLNLGRRVSKRLAGQNPEAAADLDLGERVLPAVVDKSASPSPSVNVCSQELLQYSDRTPETGKSDQASLNGEASLDELPPGWKKEIKITKKAHGIRKDPLYIDPVHGYVFRSKKDVFRYLQTGDISSCAIRPVKRDLDATTKETSPTTVDTNSKKLGCSVTERQPFAAKESRGQKRSVTCSPEIQAESSKKQPESGASNANAIVKSTAAGINAKQSTENAEISLDTEPDSRGSSADTKVIAAESDAIKRLSAVSTPQSDLTPEQQLPETEHQKPINKEKLEQSRRSRTKKPLTPGRRISKRLVGHSPEPVADLDLGERAFRAVVKKSASLGIPLNVSGQEFSQNKDPKVGTDNSDQASLSREAAGVEFPPDVEKEILIQDEDPTVGTGNCDQASLRKEAPGDELSPGLEKEILSENKDSTVGTGNCDQASLSKEASGNELSPGLEKELLAQNEDSMVGTGNSDQASLSREASGDKLSPGLEKELLAQNKDPTVGTGNSDQASLSREASGDESSPGLEKEILAQNKDPTVGTGNSDQASLLEKEILSRNKDPTVGSGNSDQSSLSREASGDKSSPGLEKEILARNKDPTVGTGNSDQSSLSRKASGDKLSPGLEKDMLTQNKDPTVGTDNSGQSSVSRKASVDELSPGLEKEILTQNKDLTVVSCNSDQASLRREASLDDIPPGWEKETLGKSKYSTVGTGNSNQPSLSRKLSPDEIPPGWENEIPTGWKYEIPAHNKDPIIGTSNSDQSSLSREEASLDEIPPGWEKEILTYNKCATIRTGKSDQVSLGRELASADELPPGWEKEMLIQNKYPTLGTGNSNSLDDIPPGWEKEILVQNKDPTVRTGNSNQSLLSKEASADELPPGWKKEFRMRKHSRGIKKDPFYTDPVHGYVFRSKKDVMRYLQTGDIRSCAVKPTKRDLDTTRKDNSTSTHDTSSKKLRCSLTGRQLSATEESKGSKCSVTCSLALHAENSNEHPESSMLNLNTSISSIEAISPQSDYLPEQHLPEIEKEKLNNKGVSKGMRKFRNSKSSTPVRRVSKRLSRHNPEMMADLDTGERALHAVVNNSASSGLPMNVSGGELAQRIDLATGDSVQPSLSRKASSRDDPFKVVRCLSEGQAFKEKNDERILQDSQPAGISHERGKVHLEHHAVKQRPTGKLAKEEQDGQNRLLDNSQPAEPSWRNVDLNVENQQWQDVQLAPSQRSVDLNMENQQWPDSQLAPSQRSVDLNVENQQWQDPQLAEPSRRNLDLNVENQPVKEKQTGELVTENQDEQNRRLHAQLASYPFGDYWSDPCLEFAFKTLTGAIPVEDTLTYQGSTHQEYNTSYTQADDGCFELSLFNTSSFYMNDVPNHSAPSEEHVVKEQPPINQTFSTPGNNSTPGHSSVVSQNPGLTVLPNGNNSTPGCSSVVSQNPGLDSQAKDYQSKFKSQR